jgi:hypothetical protein
MKHDDIFDTAASIVRAQAAMVAPRAVMAEPEPHLPEVYLLWLGRVLLGVCGTYARAEQEKIDFERHNQGQITPLKIEKRRVHP